MREENFPSRSSAIAELIRRYISSSKWRSEGKGIGVILIVYNHHRRDVATNVLEIQHTYGSVILSTQHIHISKHRCLEILAVKGDSKKINELYRTLRGTKGIEYASLEVI